MDGKETTPIKEQKMVRMVDTPTIRAELVSEFFRNFKERSPGPSGITRTLLLHAPRNIHQIYEEIFCGFLGDGLFPEIL